MVKYLVQWQRWRALFLANHQPGSPAETLPWHDAYRLTPAERERVAASVQQFQLGEASEGRGFIAAAARAGGAAAEEAVRLFVQEEQRHSRHLGRFLAAQEIPCLERHWVDGVFRWLRGLAGLELYSAVLVTAECIAVPYYRALRAATRSPLLQAICDVILAEEAHHLRFQGQILGWLRGGRRAGFRWRAHRWFLTATCGVVWLEHRAVLKPASRFRKFHRDAQIQLGVVRRAGDAQGSHAARVLYSKHAASAAAAPVPPDAYASERTAATARSISSGEL